MALTKQTMLICCTKPMHNSIMHLSLRENSVPGLPLRTDRPPPPDESLEPPSNTLIPDPSSSPHFLTEEEDHFTLQPTNRDFVPAFTTPQRSRIIPMGMLNRACMNVYSLSGKKLTAVPRDIVSILEQNHIKVGLIQRLDLSNNTIGSLDPLPFQQLQSLKELLVRQNKIRQLPHQRLNLCKQLRVLNAEWNQINVVPPLSKIAFLFLRHNQVKLITSELKDLKIQGMTLDWMQYLIDHEEECQVNTSEQFGSHVEAYQKLKDQIICKVNYSVQNSHFFDFHACMIARLSSSRYRSPEKTLSILAYRAIMSEDTFLLEYLRDYHNAVNFPAMLHANRLLLEYALEIGNQLGLQLFQLCKSHYNEQMPQITYLESLKLTCKYGNAQLFEYLTRMRHRKQIMQDPTILKGLIKETVEKFNPKKESRNILSYLMRYYRQASREKVTFELPVSYNYRVFKAVSSALLADDDCFQQFQLQSTHRRTTSLHFAVRARNDELVYRLAKRGDDVFGRNEWGTMCKNISSSTQTSRKVIWKQEKRMLRKLWSYEQRDNHSEWGELNTTLNRKDLSASDCLPLPCTSPTKAGINPSTSQQTINTSINQLLAYPQLQPLFFAYHKSLKGNPAALQHLANCAKLLHKTYSHERLPGMEDFHLIMARTDVMTYLLRTLPRNLPGEYLSRLEEWQAVKIGLVQLYRLLEEGRDDLIGYQVVACAEMMGEEGRKGRVGSKDAPNFWCCQNVAYE